MNIDNSHLQVRLSHIMDDLNILDSVEENFEIIPASIDSEQQQKEQQACFDFSTYIKNMVEILKENMRHSPYLSEDALFALADEIVTLDNLIINLDEDGLYRTIVQFPLDELSSEEGSSRYSLFSWVLTAREQFINYYHTFKDNGHHPIGREYFSIFIDTLNEIALFIARAIAHNRLREDNCLDFAKIYRVSLNTILYYAFVDLPERFSLAEVLSSHYAAYVNDLVYTYHALYVEPKLESVAANFEDVEDAGVLIFKYDAASSSDILGTLQYKKLDFFDEPILTITVI